MADAVDERARWAEAQSLLDRVPTESAQQRLRRLRRRTVLVIAVAVLVPLALAGVLVVVLRGTFAAEPAAVPTWQAIVGFVIAGAGLVVQLGGVVAAWRGNRRLRVWSSPLRVLTRAQNKELLASVRGQRPVEPDRVPLARLRAEHLLHSRNMIISSSGLEIAWVGLWIAEPTVWRAVFVVAYAVLLGVAWVLLQRDVSRARRFLAAHPLSAGDR